MRRHLKPSLAVTLALAATATALPASASRPPAEPIVLPPPRAVHIPVDGDRSPGRALKNNIIVPQGSSPAPRLPIKLEKIPKIVPINLAAELLPFRCTDANECAYERMPIYNQGNPNFAFVNAPVGVYGAEKHPVGGAYEQKNGQWGVLMSNSLFDPYYESWLPFGPLPGDDGNIGGIWFTAICAPTSESMALMTALANRSATTRVKPGSWVDLSFIKAAKPSAQMALPSPLHVDHNTLAPNSQQMTAQEIQRVINMAELQKTDPSSGGLADAIESLSGDFSYSGKLPGPHPVFRAQHGGDVTHTLFAQLMKEGYVVVMAIHPRTVHVALQGSGATAKYHVTFDGGGGHVLAVNGYANGKSSKPTYTIYDPVYANAITRTIERIGPTASKRNGHDVVVELPAGVSGMGIMQYDDAPVITSSDDLQDGQKVFFVDEWHAVGLE